MRSVAIAGAGIAGRLMALRLARAGWQVTLFDRHGWRDRTACSYAAAGLLAPVAEGAQEGAYVYALGRDSVAQWTEIVEGLTQPVTIGSRGTLAAARFADLDELEDFRAKLVRRLSGVRLEYLDRAAIAELEPDLSPSTEAALWLPDEGHIHNFEAMDALADTLVRLGVRCRLGETVEKVAPHEVWLAGGREMYDWVVDTRGVGARSDLRDLRGVRGELVELHAPEVELSRPVRVLHHRYPIYIVPRGPRTYAVGATCIESENPGPPTVTALLELLGAVYDLSPGFRQAHVTRTIAALRPAFSDNFPRIRAQDGLVRLNGLFRHGFLVSPAVTLAAAGFLEHGRRPAGLPEEWGALFEGGER